MAKDMFTPLLGSHRQKPMEELQLSAKSLVGNHGRRVMVTELIFGKQTKAALFAVLAIALPLYAEAQSGLGYDNPISAVTITGIVDLIVQFAISIITPLSAIAILVAAFLYITSGGSETRVAQGHKALTYGVIGLAIVTSAQFLIDVIVGFAGGAVDSSSFADFLEKMAQTFGTVLLAGSVLAILYSSFLFMTRGQEEKERGAAIRVLTYAIVGVAVALFAYAIPALIKSMAP